ncbi:aldo/keto reductase [Enterococcus hermanniensis]|uniref:Oxidoreductase ion channel protein IolS n=1 Tax=Enterococcus hermanniensis TaxID=249189 RepID=A0A1L8TQ38_9ENTE|nr:aldo/keto reductase [Enterococcus hermanniensis]OJG46184.1 oxidoreductase ion channel protein IolS [Enterococcus hermanniensis]
MKTSKIGYSEVIVSKLGLGTNKVGGHNLFDNLDEKDGYDQVRAALDAGITLLDTAYVYGLGRSEEIIGEVLKEYDRSKVVIATKAAQDPANDLKLTNDPAFLTKAVDEALVRLQTDYIDIFYIHFPDEKTNKSEAVAALDKLKKAGKIRAVGVSNFSLEQLKEANRDGLVDIVEEHYNLVHREPEDRLFEYLRENNIAFVPYFPLASGLLTGKYSEADYEKFDKFSKEQFTKIIQNLVVVKDIAESHEATVLQIILAWYMKNPDIAAVIPGARNAEQVSGLVKAAEISLSESEYEKIDEAFTNR